MAECSEIEAGGEVRTIKDATARSGVATNTTAIEEINTKIPSNASASNKMATASDLSSLINLALGGGLEPPFTTKQLILRNDIKGITFQLFDKNQTGLSLDISASSGITIDWVLNGQLNIRKVIS